MIIDRDDVPGHLMNVREIDLTGDILAERVEGQWFRLGARTREAHRTQQNVDEAVLRQSVLLDAEGFAVVFDHLESVGNVFSGIGKPNGVIRESGGLKNYAYTPFHQFEFPFTRTIAEPLVFFRQDTNGDTFFVNPDLWMYFELEERAVGSGIWRDPRRGVDVLVKRILDECRIETVEIRTDYLLKYLRTRQKSLVVGHYRHLFFFDPPEAAIAAFFEGDITLGSAKQGAKAIFQNWGLRKDFGDGPFLQRRLHLWFEIKPPELDVNNPWDEELPLDPYRFTLPTSVGPVAPARWKHLRLDPSRTLREFSATSWILYTFARKY